MKYITILFVFISVVASAVASGTNAVITPERIAGFCAASIEERLSKNDVIVTEVFVTGYKSLKSNIVLVDIILVNSITGGKMIKTEVEGLCRYLPKTNNIKWQAF